VLIDDLIRVLLFPPPIQLADISDTLCLTMLLILVSHPPKGLFHSIINLSVKQYGIFMLSINRCYFVMNTFDNFLILGLKIPANIACLSKSKFLRLRLYGTHL
jgi:hypothetical protein